MVSKDRYSRRLYALFSRAGLRACGKTPLLALLVLLTACAVPYAPPPPPPMAKADLQDLTEVFAVGYRNISEKYIVPISAEVIALDGLSGLSSIDPALQVHKRGKSVVLSYSGNMVTSRKAPTADNSVAWALVTTDITIAAKSVSADMLNASNEKVFEAVFDGVLSGLDIFSRYAGAEEAKRNRARRDGFGGIGVTFKIKHAQIIVTAVLPGTPAEDAGLRTGDVITAINGKPAQGLSRSTVVSRLRGPTQTDITITVRSPQAQQTNTVVLTRQHIVPVTVTEKRYRGLLYFKIASFNQDTARSLSAKLTKAQAEMGSGLKAIALDLRGNPGGLLKQSVKVADLLLSHGKIVSTRGRHLDSLHDYDASGDDVANGIPVAVFIDGKSASAAEIVAAALQDRNRAVVIGTSSYGKGTVQTVIRLPNDGEITLTWSRFMAPSGYPLHGLGVRPSVCTSTQDRSAEQIIKETFLASAELKTTFESWRLPSLQAEDIRSKLRATCPPEKHQAQAEMAVAKRLLGDSIVYDKALDLSAKHSQARKE